MHKQNVVFVVKGSVRAILRLLLTLFLTALKSKDTVRDFVGERAMANQLAHIKYTS